MALRRSIALAAITLLITSGVVLATHAPATGLQSFLLARGTWDRAERGEFVDALRDQRRLESSDVAVVRATLTPGGTTNWHEHPGPSVVIVSMGSITVTEVNRNGSCTDTTYDADPATAAPGAFNHTARIHSFTGGASGAEFYVTYFAPVGAGLLVHPGPLPTCVATGGDDDDDDGDD